MGKSIVQNMIKTKSKIFTILLSLILLPLVVVLFSACGGKGNSKGSQLSAQEAFNKYTETLNKMIALNTLTVNVDGTSVEGSQQCLYFFTNENSYCLATTGGKTVETWYETSSDNMCLEYQHIRETYKRYRFDLEGRSLVDLNKDYLYLNTADIVFSIASDPVMIKQSNGKYVFTYTIALNGQKEQRTLTISADGLVERIEVAGEVADLATGNVATTYSLNIAFTCNQTVAIPTRPTEDDGIHWETDDLVIG